MNRNVLATTLLDEMIERDWSISDVVVASGKTKNPEYGIAFLALQMYLCVEEPGVRFGDEELSDLGNAFGVSKEFFVNLQQKVIEEEASAAQEKEGGMPKADPFER